MHYEKSLPSSSSLREAQRRSNPDRSLNKAQDWIASPSARNDGGKKAHNAVKVKGQVRIIGGKFRSRKILFSDSPGLRPTTDRIRETLFNWLAPVISGAECLDVFGGSGVLSFEAISRGAAHVLLIEKSQQTLEQIAANAKKLEIPSSQLSLIGSDALKSLASLDARSFDIIFLDPPFDADLLYPCIQRIVQHQLIRENGFIYIETHLPILNDKIPADWKCLKEKKAGQVYYYLYSCNLTKTDS